MNINESKTFTLVLVVIAMLVGVAIRWTVAMQDGLWLDELHTAWVTGDAFSDVAHRAAQGNQSPLFFWLTWFSVQLIGKSVLALRLVSLVAGTCLMGVAAWLIWKWTHSAIASFVVAWLIAIDPWSVFYSTEARPYCLLGTLAVFQVALFWRLIAFFETQPSDQLSNWHDESDQRQPGRCSQWPWMTSIGLVLISSAMFYCHYTSVWLFIAEILFYAGYCLVVKFKLKTPFRFFHACATLITVAAVGCLICLPGIWHLLEVFDRRGNWALVSNQTELLFELRWPLLLKMVLPVAAAAMFYSPNRETIDARLFGLKSSQLSLVKISFVLLWALIPVVCVLLLDYFRIAPLALYRYTLVGAVAIPIFAGLCVALSGNGLGQVAIGAVVVLASLVSQFEGGQLVFNPFANQLVTQKTIAPMRLENWSGPIREINGRQDKQIQPVFLFSNLIEDVHAFATDDADFQEYLLFPLNGIDILDRSNRATIAAPTMFNQHFRPTDVELMKGQGGGWLIIRSAGPHLVTSICNELRTLASKLKETELEETELEETELKETELKETELEETELEETGLEEADKEKADNDEAKLERDETKTAEIKIQFAQFPDSDVFLVSVDWKYPETKKAEP